jgi:hypothetical protein
MTATATLKQYDTKRDASEIRLSDLLWATELLWMIFGYAWVARQREHGRYGGRWVVLNLTS